MALRLTGACIERSDFRLGPLNVEVHWGERVAIVGPNGAGKTSLLDALLGRLPLTAGTRWVGPSVIVGTLEQGRTRLTGDAPLLELVRAPQDRETADVRSQLAKFGLTAEHLSRPGATLSPGERTRAVLAEFALQGVNCLVLDEPSNHLDLRAIEELEAALNQYTGTLLLVSHDRALLDHVTIERRLRLRAGGLDET